MHGGTASRSTPANSAHTSASRRGGRGGATARHKKAVAEDGPKTQLFAEWRTHEEDCAARVIQRQARAFLSRVFVRSLLAGLYEKQYDPIEKQYYYVNTRTNESSWEKPKVLTMFLRASDEDAVVAAKKAELTASEAAQRIQRCARALLARRSMKNLVREIYMKLFDADTKRFYYLNTRTGATADHKPAFLRGEREDLEIEQFHFRKAVVKIATTTNMYGSGVIGRFCGMLCVLSDGKTLASEEIAQSAHVVCNYANNRMPFQLVLASERFFAGISVQADSKTSTATTPTASSMAKASCTPKAHDFALCALDEAQFQGIASTNIIPLQFELNDRKMGCADDVRVQDPIEIVGHPHGKMQVVHARRVTQMVPNSISPMHVQYDSPTESGSAGSAVFTRGGKLLGMQSFLPLKDAPRDCWFMKPILDTAALLIARWYKPLRGLALHYELEICCHKETQKDARRHGKFESAYMGRTQSRHIGGLTGDTLYSIRCRAVNCMKKSKWSSVMRFITLPTPSMAWRLKHCSTLAEAIKRMKQSRPNDPQTHLKSLQWIFAQLESAKHDRAQSELFETELLECHGVELVCDAISWFPDHRTNVLLSLHVLAHLAKLQARSQMLLGSLQRMQSICDLLKLHTPTFGKSKQQEESEPDALEKDADELRVPIACIALLGFILEQNDSAKQIGGVCGLVPLVLSFLDRDSYRHQPLVVAECCYLLGVFSYANVSRKWDIVEAHGLPLLRDALEAYLYDSKVLYWTLVTLGNVAYACSDEQRSELEAQINALFLIDTVCACRTQFLTRLHDLELDFAAAKAKLAHLQATHIGEEMRNEMDACEHEVATLAAVIAEAHTHNVAHTADYALRYLLTAEQLRVQQASKQIMRKFLHRKLATAHQRWCEVTVYERHRAIFLKFFATVKDRQLSAAFRRWEGVVREMRRHKSVMQTIGSGLAMDLAKKKKERYRMLVLQK